MRMSCWILFLILSSTLTPNIGSADEKSTGSIERTLLEPIDASRSRTVPICVYRLAEQDQPQPVVLFSHGLGGSRMNNAYLGDNWAENGFTAVFLQHPGSDESVWKQSRLRERLSAMKEAANAKNLMLRVEDVSFILKQLSLWNEQPDHPLLGRLDMQQVGLSGHSFGAMTTLTTATAQANGRVDGVHIDAFLPMSPQPGQRANNQRLISQIQSPVLCMTGTRDGNRIDPRVTPETRREVYRSLPDGDKYELVLDGAEHSAFSGGGDGIANVNRDPDHFPAIQNLSTLFWKAYLQQDTDAQAILQSEQVRQHAPLKSTDLWLHK